MPDTNGNFVLLLCMTALVIVWGAKTAYQRWHDALHPLVFLGPLFLYGFAVSPWLLYASGRMELFFDENWKLEYVQTVLLLGVVVFVHGGLHGSRAPSRDPRNGMWWPGLWNESICRRVVHVSVVFGCIAVAGYLSSVWYTGGFGIAYSGPKGHVTSISGYIGEAPMLAYPAVMLLALARRGQGIRFRDAALAVFYVMPQLLHGTLGGRRGPLFLSLSCLAFFYFVAKNRRPTFGAFIPIAVVIYLVFLAVWSHRQDLYLGSEKEWSRNRILERLIPSEQEAAGETYIHGAGTILNAQYYQKFYWGKRYATILLVRPIPKALWPDKYKGTLLDRRLKGNPEWLESVGWRPFGGSACSFISDAYAEFSWGCLVVCYFMGRMFGRTWILSKVRGGVWVLLLAEMSILGVYLPTQSLSAFWHRLLYMGTFTVLGWWLYVEAGVQVMVRETVRLPKPCREEGSRLREGTPGPQPVSEIGYARLINYEIQSVRSEFKTIPDAGLERAEDPVGSPVLLQQERRVSVMNQDPLTGAALRTQN